MTNPWMIMPTTFETTQYIARPLENCSVKNPNSTGIIHSIIRLVEACLGSTDGMVVIFCIRNMDTPTRIGNSGTPNGPGSGRPRSCIHRNELLSGMTSLTRGSQG